MVLCCISTVRRIWPNQTPTKSTFPPPPPPNEQNPPLGTRRSKVFGKEEADVPVHMVLWSCPAEDPRFLERTSATLEERFPMGSRWGFVSDCFFWGGVGGGVNPSRVFPFHFLLGIKKNVIFKIHDNFNIRTCVGPFFKRQSP